MRVVLFIVYILHVIHSISLAIQAQASASAKA